MRVFYYLIVFSILIALSSCGDMEKEISWETESIPHNLVVEGSIKTDSIYQLIKLKESGDYFENEAPIMISEAKVIVTFNSDTLSFIESDSLPGWYYSAYPFKGEIGVTYHLSIELNEPIEGESNFEADADIQQQLRIDSIQCKTYENPFSMYDTDTSYIVLLTLYGKEPAGVDNYYAVKFYRNDTLMNDTVTKYQIFTDEDYDIDGYTVMYIPVYYVEYNPNDAITIEVLSLTEDYYNFIDACQLIATPQDPFGFTGPPANAVGNVNDGTALGYFYGASISRGNTIVTQALSSDN